MKWDIEPVEIKITDWLKWPEPRPIVGDVVRVTWDDSNDAYECLITSVTDDGATALFQPPSSAENSA